MDICGRIILGMPLGYIVTYFIFKNTIGDVYDFDAYIKPISYILLGIGTFIVTYLSRKVDKVDMVTS